MMAIGSQVNVQRNIAVYNQIQSRVSQRTAAKTLQAIHRLIAQDNTVSVQDLGRLAQRATLSGQQNRTPQDRFLDLYI